MRLFDLPQAKHFCAPSVASLAAVSSQSLAVFHAGLGPSISLFVEPTSGFAIHQVNLLQSTQRWLMYSLAHYRRAVEMMVPVSAPWAHVTLYYSSFFAANAILGMFGGWIGLTKAGTRVVDVERGAPGSQALRVHRRLASPAGAAGSHRIFWDFYYDAVASISAWAPTSLQPALQPVNNDFAWQIAARNCVNYDMFDAWSASRHFFDTFKAAKLNTLRGPLQLQLETTQRLVNLGLWFAKDLSLSASAVVGCGVTGTRQQIQRRLITQKPPALVMQSALPDLLEA
jgi:hypothetical protein